MKIKGKELNIYKIVNNTPIAVACSTSCSIDTKADVIETSIEGSGSWKTYLTNRNSWTVSCSWLVESEAYLKSSILSIGSEIYLSARISDELVSGKAIITQAKVTANRGSLIQGSFQFTGTGPLE